jgi:methylmalonyl-CoA mutase C-terminal domain/subunit
MDQLDLNDIPLLLGGIVPDNDRRQLLGAGIGAIFGPGASLDDIVAAIHRLTAPTEDEAPRTGKQSWTETAAPCRAS